LEQVLDEAIHKLELGQSDPEWIRSTVKRAFEELGYTADIPLKVAEFRASLDKESDRGCALLAAAYLEYELGMLIQVFLIDDATLVKDFFRGTGPLATFSARIDTAYLFGLIPRAVRQDLHLIRKIRNDFAHHPEQIEFTESSIASRCGQLQHDAFQQQLAPRATFIRVVMGVLGYIHAVSHTAKRPEVPPDLQLNREDLLVFSQKVRETINRVSMNEAESDT
jgi:DNA-binding MltR family transcriptional regulator